MRSPEIVKNSPFDGRATVEEGQTVELSCTAVGNPRPQIKWRRNNARPMKYVGKDGLVTTSK
jgi:hypothetical protein